MRRKAIEARIHFHGGGGPDISVTGDQVLSTVHDPVIGVLHGQGQTVPHERFFGLIGDLPGARGALFFGRGKKDEGTLRWFRRDINGEDLIRAGVRHWRDGVLAADPMVDEIGLVPGRF